MALKHHFRPLNNHQRFHSMRKSRKIKAPRDRMQHQDVQITIDTEGAGVLAAELQRLRVQLMMEKEAAVAQLKEEHAL